MRFHKSCSKKTDMSRKTCLETQSKEAVPTRWGNTDFPLQELFFFFLLCVFVCLNTLPASSFTFSQSDFERKKEMQLHTSNYKKNWYNFRCSAGKSNGFSLQAVLWRPQTVTQVPACPHHIADILFFYLRRQVCLSCVLKSYFCLNSKSQIVIHFKPCSFTLWILI